MISPYSPNVWTPPARRIERVPLPEVERFPGEHEIVPARCMPTGIMAQRMPLKPFNQSPLPLPPIVWYKSDIEVYSDTALTTLQTTNNGPVNGWKDQSGNAHHVTNGGDDLLDYKTNVIGSYPGIQSTLADRNSRLENAFTWAQPSTQFLVVRIDSYDSFKCLVDGYNSTGNTQIHTIQQWNVSGEITCITNMGATFLPRVTYSVGSFFIVEAVYNTTSSYIKVNGNAAGTGTLTADTIAGITICNAARTVTVLTSLSPRATYVEVIGFDSALSDSDSTTVRNYLNTKYTIF